MAFSEAVGKRFLKLLARLIGKARMYSRARRDVIDENPSTVGVPVGRNLSNLPSSFDQARNPPRISSIKSS